MRKEAFVFRSNQCVFQMRGQIFPTDVGTILSKVFANDNIIC